MEFLNTTNWREALHQTEELFEELKNMLNLITDQNEMQDVDSESQESGSDGESDGYDQDDGQSDRISDGLNYQKSDRRSEQTEDED